MRLNMITIANHESNSFGDQIVTLVGHYADDTHGTTIAKYFHTVNPEGNWEPLDTLIGRVPNAL